MNPPIFTKPLQICVVVDDIDGYMKTYTDDYGIGPWAIFEFNPDTITDMTIRGEKVDYAMTLAVCDFYGIQWELIQPRDDHNLYTEFLKEHGPGLHHVAFAADNHNKVVKWMAERGNRSLQGGNLQGNVYTYLDTVKDLGFITEIYNTPKNFVHPGPDRTYPPQDDKATAFSWDKNAF
ncbi:VOC family protein [Alicyclobacillus dauci]|uniref:VOC family protein n=1 Tax=Alicyclobacillus dauci TaxID=1475485 RepID=A0ABY6Z009_9BACL|nr:VOC family protein [Alicyclobacillus dauci]WAH35706.1 VOC family protein [Alicyclobacillus dauci]